MPEQRGPADHRCGLAAARGARVRRPGRCAAAPRGADVGRLAARGDPAPAACRPCSAGSPKRPTPTRACSASGRSATASARRTGTCGCCATRAPRPSGWPSCWPPAGMRPTCCCGRRRRPRCSPTTPTCCHARATPSCARRCNAAQRYADPVEAIAAVRAVRRRELFRVAAADVFGLIDVDAVGRALTDIARATLEGGLAAATRAIEAERREPLQTEPGGDRDGPARRRRDVVLPATPTCSSCTSRCPAPTSAPPPRRPSRSRTSCAGCSPCPARIRPSSSTPTCGPRAGRGRWSARWRRTRSTTSAGRRSGRRRRCCAPTRSRATRSWAQTFVELIDPLRYPAKGLSAGRRHRGAPDQGPGRRRAAAARGRPEHPRQARPRWPGRRRVDGPAAADAVCRPASRAADDPDHRRARRGGRSRPCQRLDCRRADPGLAAGQPDPQRHHAGAGQGRRTRCRHTPATGSESPSSAATTATRPAASATTTCASPAAPAPPSTRSSGTERAWHARSGRRVAGQRSAGGEALGGDPGDGDDLGLVEDAVALAGGEATPDAVRLLHHQRVLAAARQAPGSSRSTALPAFRGAAGPGRAQSRAERRLRDRRCGTGRRTAIPIAR